MNDNYIFKKAKEFKNLYQMVNDKNYLIFKQSKNDWKYFDHLFDKRTHYKGIVLINESIKEIAIFNIGTDFRNIKDICANLKMLFKGVTAQMKIANAYYRKIKGLCGQYKIFLVGHSEGGSECQYVSALNPEAETYTYNAFGIGTYPEVRDSDAKNVYNFRNRYDLVSKISAHFGCVFVVFPKDKTARGVFIGFKHAHQIKNMGEIENASL